MGEKNEGEFLHTVLESEAGMRIDSALCALTDCSRNRVQALIEEGAVTVCGARCDKNRRLKTGESLRLVMPAPTDSVAKAEELPLEIVFEDDFLCVVNKAKGMVVHPAAGNESGTLVNALLFHCGGSLSGIGGVIRPGIVHRIDKDTSGLLIVAKCDEAHRDLAEQIKTHSFTREYAAVLVGRVKEEQFTVDAPIGRSERDRKKMAVTTKNSKNAVTHFTLEEELSGHCLVTARLETGRTHQIRVHAAYIGHPVAGDTVYGGRKPVAGLAGQCLHAKKLGFVHPITGEYMEFSAPLPQYFEDFLTKLRS